MAARLAVMFGEKAEREKVGWGQKTSFGKEGGVLGVYGD